MKHQKFFGVFLTVCTLLLTLAGCTSGSTFDGNSVKNADSYLLEVKTMNCTDTHTLELKQGDTLKILFETVKGSLDMKITAPDGTALYQGDGTVTEFTVTAPLDGAYAIVVVGQKAKGRIYIDAERVTRDEGETENGGEDESETSELYNTYRAYYEGDIQMLRVLREEKNCFCFGRGIFPSQRFAQS